MEKNSSTFNFKFPAGLARAVFFVMLLDALISAIVHIFPVLYTGYMIPFFSTCSIVNRIRFSVLPPEKVKKDSVFQSGWLDQMDDGRVWEAVDRDLKDKIIITSFGQSFSDNIARLLPEFDSRMKVLSFVAPNAPPNWSYEKYRRCKTAYPAQVRILGIFEFAVPGLSAMTSASVERAYPKPYMFPRFYLRKGELVAVQPVFNNLRDFQNALIIHDGMAPLIRQLNENDIFYNWDYEESFLDYSIVTGWIRNSLVNIRREFIMNTIMGSEGFYDKSEVITVLKALVVQFADDCREEKTVPVVLIFSMQGSRDNLKNILQNTIKSSGIVSVAAGDIIDLHNPSNFLWDGHYTKEMDRRIAKEVAYTISEAMKNRLKLD